MSDRCNEVAHEILEELRWQDDGGAQPEPQGVKTTDERCSPYREPECWRRMIQQLQEPYSWLNPPRKEFAGDEPIGKLHEHSPE